MNLFNAVKEFYKDFNNGLEIYDLNRHMANLINQSMPESVFEFGCGTGKNLDLLSAKIRGGIDLSQKAIDIGHEQFPELSINCYDEQALHFIKDNQFDVSFTVSVLDHIPGPEAEDIVKHLKRIAKKVYVAESNDVWQNYCFPHNYEDMGFTKLDYKWISPTTGAEYHIYEQ